MYDAVVVGVGGVGSFCLRALSKQGAKCLGIERFGHNHSRGSSHGLTRIYRRAYFEHPSYVPWIEYSLKEFRKLESSKPNYLMQECGTLLLGTPTSSRRNDSSDMLLPPLLQASYDCALQHGIDVEYIRPQDVPDRFPQFPTHAPLAGMYEPAGGFLRPERILQAAVQEALEGTVDLKENTIVTAFRPIGDSHVEVELECAETNERTVVETKYLLVSAGGWAGQLLDEWSPHLTALRQLSGWLDVSETPDPTLYSYRNMPTFVMDAPREWPWPLYGLPCDDGSDPTHAHWLKVGVHGRPEELSNASDNPAVLNETERQELRTVASRTYALGSDPVLVKATPCLYTMSPDGNYIMGALQRSSRVFGVAGLSGHGFKMTPTLGAIMADYALGQDMSKWEMDFCSPDRFS